MLCSNKLMLGLSNSRESISVQKSTQIEISLVLRFPKSQIRLLLETLSRQSSFPTQLVQLLIESAVFSREL